MRLLRSATYIFSASAFSAVLSFLGIPYFVSVLTVEEYGLLGVFYTFNSILLFFFHLNCMIFVEREYYADTYSRVSLLRSGFLLISLCSSIFFFILLFSNYALDITNYFSVQKNFFFVILLVTYLQAMAALLQTFLRLEDLNKQFSFSVVLQSASQLGFSIFFLSSTHLSWKGIVYGYLVATIICLCYICHSLFRKNQFDFSIESGAPCLKNMFKVSFKLLPTTISWRIILFSDRLFVTEYVGLKAMGQFTLLNQVLNIFKLVVSSFAKAWTPYFMKFKKKSSQLIIRNQLMVSFVFLALFLLFVFLLPVLIKELLPTAYHEIEQYLYLAWLLPYLSLIHMFFSNYLVVLCKYSLMSSLVVIAAILNLFLNYFLVLDFEVIGVIFSTIFCYALIVVFEFLVVRKFYSKLT